jgi:hypothetical protein
MPTVSLNRDELFEQLGQTYSTCLRLGQIEFFFPIFRINNIPPPLLSNYSRQSSPVPAEEEFDDLCFRFGVELDEVVSSDCPPSKIL